MLIKLASKEMKDGDFVLPGYRIGVIEMYVSGAGTYEDNGIIHASITGKVKIDNVQKRVSVVPMEEKPSLPKEGDIVIGKIQMVRKRMAIADITNKPGFAPTSDFEGMIHISQVSKTYLENLSDAFKTDDIIRAVIIDETRIPFILSTSGPDFGVILAHCSECGEVLKPVGKRLQCPACRTIEKRKFAQSYGTYKF
jgi:exosome complex component CSL4